ncbi:unnamed protein product [Lota lota]
MPGPVAPSAPTKGQAVSGGPSMNQRGGLSVVGAMGIGGPPYGRIRPSGEEAIAQKSYPHPDRATRALATSSAMAVENRAQAHVIINDGVSLSKTEPRPVAEFLDLTRCAACYCQKGRSMPHHRTDSESSSDVSDREVDSDSSSSSSSEAASRAGEDQGDTAGSPASGSRAPEALREHASETIEQGGLEETSAAGWEAQERQEETKEEVQNRDIEDMKTVLLSSPSRGLFRRPPSVVSTLQLQALPSNHGDVTVYTQAGYSCPE